MKLTSEIVAECREAFPALVKTVNNQPAIYFDGPGGTQATRSVAEAMTRCLLQFNANEGGQFATSQECDAELSMCHQALADFLNADDANCVVFGQNMTSLTFALSRALARTWKPGDEVVVTRLDHDANVTPWVLAARDAGATVRMVDFRHNDCTLDMADFAGKLSNKTKLVAVGAASNAVGTVNPVREIAKATHEVGALCFVDAVHYAPHRRVDVRDWNCDFLACSTYKFFGPHLGVLWGRRSLLESLEPYKVRPATNELPGKWMTGTQSHEAILGARAAVDYLADLGRRVQGRPELARREALAIAYRSIQAYESQLLTQLLQGLARLPEIQVRGITDPARYTDRVATVAFTHARYTSRQLAQRLGEQGIFAWHGNYYALNLTEALGLEPEGMLRVGMVHYNTPEEVQRLLGALQEL
jgi:cysteine desulfurase family protein (TIGR01976 family)